MLLFTSLMQLHYSSSTFYEQVLESASISFWHELFIIYGWWCSGFGFHRQVYYIHLALTALASSKTQLFSQHLFLMFIILLDVKTFRECNPTLVWRGRDWGGGVRFCFVLFFFCGKHRKSFLFKSVLIAKAEGNCFIVMVCQRTWIWGTLYVWLGTLDVKERRQNFKMRWDWCALPSRESGSEGCWDWDFALSFSNTGVQAPLWQQWHSLGSSILMTCVIWFVLGLQC